MKSIIAIASGKGGVGKSTVAVNLAVSLANNVLPGEPAQRRVALVDIDLYGPSIPTLMGGGQIQVNHEEKFIPPMKYGVKYISIAFFLRQQDDAIIWRGPMFGKAITQLFQDTAWGDIDICVVDLPPGTGDAQISLSQLVKLDGAVLVTTPQEVALADVRRALNMFRKVNVPVLGVIENMAGFITPSGERVDIFGKGGGQQLASSYGVPFLGSIPIDVQIREGGDKGEPVAVNAETALGRLYFDIAAKTVQEADRARSNAPAMEVIS